MGGIKMRTAWIVYGTQYTEATSMFLKKDALRETSNLEGK